MASAAVQVEVKSSTKVDLFGSPGKRRVVLSLLLVLLALAVFIPAAYNGFVGFDDPGYVTNNTHVRGGISWDTLKWAFRSTERANWHPLTWLSHALDCQLFHLNPAGHHLTSVLLHGLAAALLFLALEFMTAMPWRSFAVAALFAVHPMNVQSVAWISERKNVLCMLFFALAVIAYRWYVLRPNVLRYSTLAGFFVLGLMAKPMVITLPSVLLLLDYWPLGRVRTGTDHSPTTAWMRLVLEKAPLFVLSAASAVITLIAQRAAGAIRADHAFPVRLANAAVSYLTYLSKAIWPARLAAFYPYPVNAPALWKVLGACVALIAISVAVLLLRRQRYLAVGWFWYLGTLVPVIGLVQAGEQSMADRYAYLPFIGLFVAAVWGIADLASSRRAQVVASGLAALVLVAFSLDSRMQIGYWKNSVTLWSHTLAVTDRNYFAHVSLGAALINEGKLQEAVAHFQTASAINPQDAFSQLDLGVCEKRLGHIASAIEHYQAALKLSTEPSLRAMAFSNLGGIYRMQKDYKLARENYESALRMDPENSFALVGLGLIAQKTNDLKQAAEYYARGAAADPSDVHYLLLAQSLTNLGRASDAESAYAQARKLSRDWQVTQQLTAQLLQE